MPGPLNQRLAEIRAKSEAKRAPEVVAVMKGAMAALRESGILERVPVAGDQAPSFARPNLDGATIRLRALLKRGPVVVSFFRGRW